MQLTRKHQHKQLTAQSNAFPADASALSLRTLSLLPEHESADIRPAVSALPARHIRRHARYNGPLEESRSPYPRD